MHLVDLPFSCSLNERLLAVIIKRSVWYYNAPDNLIGEFRRRGAQYMDVSRDGEGYTVSFIKSHAFPLLTPEEEEQMIFILSLEN